MRKGNVAVNLSINSELAIAAHNFVKSNRRKGRKTLSEFTENLWIAYLRPRGVKLPVLLKNGDK